MLEKYHYLTFLKKCKKILDDGEVTDAEIDTLRKEENGPRPVEEALDKTSKLVFAYGRFNPPTVGHAKLMKEVMTQARKNGANHIVYASASTDKQKNPLDQKTKIKFMKKMFPQNKILAAGGTQRTFMEVLKFYNKMYGEIIMVAGSDRIGEFQRIADNYNGKDYNYKSIKVVSSGERDPDAEGVMGMSASKMREMAKNNDFKTFKTGLTNLSDRQSKKLFKAVKKGMGINESVDSFTDFINNDIREEFYQEKIFNIGDMVEHMDGTTGQIVRRGTNYVSYESDGLIKKAWLYDIQMSEEPRIPRKKGQPAGSDKHSDLYTDENPKGTIQGLGFKDVETARASVSKIKNSGKTHAHKIQAAVAMEQRAKEMGKSAEAKIYRTFIDKMKEKTKEMQKEDGADSLRFRDLLPRKLKHALYRMSKGDKYKGALNMYHRLKKDTDVRKRGLSDAKIRGIAADSYSIGHREFDKVLDRKTRYEEPSVLEALENEMGSTDEFFELNQVGVKTVESYEIGTDEYRTHTQIMTPGQKIMSFKLANKVIERKDIELFANEDKIIDKYKKRYGDRWQDELEKAVSRMKKEL
jgi:nicotinic acid mononucleotide adenylyltransferase